MGVCPSNTCGSTCSFIIFNIFEESTSNTRVGFLYSECIFIQVEKNQNLLIQSGDFDHSEPGLLYLALCPKFHPWEMGKEAKIYWIDLEFKDVASGGLCIIARLYFEHSSQWYHLHWNVGLTYFKSKKCFNLINFLRNWWQVYLWQLIFRI